MATNVNERNVPDTPTNKMLDCLWEARNLSLYTVKICSNTNNFPPEYYQTMTSDMIKKAKEEIDASLHSWKSHAELGNTYKLLQRIDAYYANLWKEIKV